MDVQREIRDFLSSRRVAGRRREEAAMLAGDSVEYYARMERCRPSPSDHDECAM
jgi:hypothetical protein